MPAHYTLTLPDRVSPYHLVGLLFLGPLQLGFAIAESFHVDAGSALFFGEVGLFGLLAT